MAGTLGSARRCIWESRGVTGGSSPPSPSSPPSSPPSSSPPSSSPPSLTSDAQFCSSSRRLEIAVSSTRDAQLNTAQQLGAHMAGVLGSARQCIWESKGGITFITVTITTDRHHAEATTRERHRETDNKGGGGRARETERERGFDYSLSPCEWVRRSERGDKRARV